METEIDALLSSGMAKQENEGKCTLAPPIPSIRHDMAPIITLYIGGQRTLLPNIDIDEMYSNLCELADDNDVFSTADKPQNTTRDSNEEFWREMEHSDDPFETVCHFLSRGYLDDI